MVVVTETTAMKMILSDNNNTKIDRKINESDHSYLQENKLQDYNEQITNDVIKDEFSVSDNGSSSDDFNDTFDIISKRIKINKS
jgi:hypothetical protein